MNRRNLFKGLAAVAAAPMIMEHIPTMRFPQYTYGISTVPGSYWYSSANVAGQVIPHLPAVNINLGSNEETYGEVILTDIGVAL